VTRRAHRAAVAARCGTGGTLAQLRQASTSGCLLAHHPGASQHWRGAADVSTGLSTVFSTEAVGSRGSALW
jgi:hypothetical protein